MDVFIYMNIILIFTDAGERVNQPIATAMTYAAARPWPTRPGA